MKVAFASDHTAADIRHTLIACIEDVGHKVLDYGSNGAKPVDYPDYAKKAICAMLSGKADEAVLVCGTGIGMSICANKFSGIRCALCTDEYAAECGRRHNHANVLALRARHQPLKTNLAIIRCWFANHFTGESRHIRRVKKIARLSQKICKGEIS